MPQRDLRALFSTNLVDLDAVHVFANRDDERSVFDAAFAAHLQTVRVDPQDPDDLVVPRRNVLVYYGVGGIGKTTLSRQLQIRLDNPQAELPAGWPLPPTVGTVLTVRLDLSREAGLDVEGLMLLLRAGLAPLGRPMVAFDLALARYWERSHRERLSDYMRQHGVIERMPQAERIPEFLNQAVSEIAGLCGLAGLGLLVQTGPTLVGYLRDRSRRRHAIEECHRLPDLLEADATLESLSYFPHLLAWDLARIQRRRDVSLVVFVDTFEEIGTRTQRELERIVQRTVWLMPNAFFVVTGRNRLDWDDPRLGDRLDWAGPVNWPGLVVGATSEPRQHLVGYLSDVDSDSYLRHRLVRQGQPAIPEAVRRRIVENSRGLPLYLDLSVMRFLTLTGAGRVAQPEDFDDAFPGVVARVFRDLDQQERTVLRAVSLLDAFDVNLATVAAGMNTDAPVLQLVQRAFVQYDPAAPWPYHIHEFVREHVRDADVGLADSWSSQDWRHAAARVADHLGEIAAESRQRHDRRVLIAALNQGLRIVHDYDLSLGWLVKGAYWFIADSVWEPTLRPRIADVDLSAGPPTTAAHALAAGLVAVAKRQNVHRGETLGVLDQCLDSGLLAKDSADLLAYFRAECLRDIGQPEESERGMRALVGPGRPMADMALRGLSHIQRRRGQFRELNAYLDQRPAEGVWHRVRGDLSWTQGLLAEASAEYGLAMDWARRERLAGELATSAACAAWAAALGSTTVGTEAIAAARQALDAVTITWAELQVRCAELVLRAGLDLPVESRCSELQALATQRGLSSSAAYAAFARAFHHAVRGDMDALAQARHALRELVHDDEFAYLCEIVDFWLGDRTTEDGFPGADWIDGPGATAARWRAAVDQRRDELEETGRWPPTHP